MNWNGKYVSIKTIIATVYRNMKVADNLDFIDAVEWAGEALELIGGPYHFEQKIATLDTIYLDIAIKKAELNLKTAQTNYELKTR